MAMEVNAAKTAGGRNIILTDKLLESINRLKINESDKNDLINKLDNKKATIMGVFNWMLNNKHLKFSNLEFAIKKYHLFNQTNVVSLLGQVDIALQAEIGVIMNMPERVNEKDQSKLSHEEKSMCLYALQGFQFMLSDIKMKDDKSAGYVNRTVIDKQQMMIKGTSLGFDWDQLDESTYNNDYSVPWDPSWHLVDLNKIQENMQDLVRYQATGNNKIKRNLNEVKSHGFKLDEKGEIIWEEDKVDMLKLSDAQIDKILNDALTQFSTKDLKNNLSTIYNFTRDALKSQSQNPDEIDYPVIQEFTMKILRHMVNIAQKQQMKSVSAQKQNNLEENAL